MQHASPKKNPAITRVFNNRLRPVGLVQEARFTGHYSPAYAAQADRLGAMYGVPPELVDIIFEAADHIIWTEIPGTRVYKHISFTRRIFPSAAKTFTPPADGSCPFIDKLPAEVRRKILVDGLGSLPSRNRTIYPLCDEDFGHFPHPHRTDNALVNLMLVSKKIRNEVAEVVYEERTFAIHVHQGFQNAGIEFLHVGRQPLQYLDHIGDGRFTKFRTGDMFGFCRLKKIEIHIFPDDGAYQHSAINTYFMHIALVRLLTRSNAEEKDRITSIRIVFPPALKPTGFDSWWDTAKDRPRETSIHGISDVELALRPFALLTRVHQVHVQLPEPVDRHVRTDKFVKSLVYCMTAKTLQNTFNSDALEMKIESARLALDDHIRRKLYGNGSRIHVPKVTGEELEEDRQSQEETEDEDDKAADDMDITPENGVSEHRHGTDDIDEDEDQESNVADYAMSNDEDGDYQDDLESLDEDIHVAPNALSEKVARFVECFSVTGDVARLYLHRNGEDIERASQELMKDSDLQESAASRRRVACDVPVAPSEHTESSYPGGGAGGPSTSEDVDRQNKGNGKGKQNARDDDDDPYKNAKWDDDNDDNDDNDDDHPNGMLSKNRFHALRASQSSMKQESDVAYMQALASQYTQSDLPRRRRRFKARNFLGMETQGDRHASSSTSGLLQGDRGRTTERSFIGHVRDTFATTNNERAPVRPSRTIVRRDSSLDLAANYSEDGQQVSEYRRYESPRATTSGRQMAEQRMRYLAGIGSTAHDFDEYRSNSHENSSPSHQPRQYGGSDFLPSALNAQPQQDSLHNEYRSPGGTAHLAFMPPQTTFASAPFSRINPSFNPPRMQFPPRAESSSTAQANAQWSGGVYYFGRGSSTLVPIAAPYPPSHVSAPTHDDWGQTVLQEFGTPVAPVSMSGAHGQITTQPSQQSSSLTTDNTVGPPSLQHSGLTSNLESMDVDATEDDSPEGAPVGTKQKQDADL
ncbi:hypothetical protein MBLNU13_g01567t1 [Cladosporium sp. NU13]